MRVHNPEYQPPVTSGSRVTGCLAQLHEIVKFKKLCTSCYSGTRSHKSWYSGLCTLIGCTLCVLSMKTIGCDSFFEFVISHGMTLKIFSK